ncbi:hypothetical protein Pelo_12962 [Pelomyxa schiedti]|nr:hypothetical protein Pelo_12962 [Pelomyxa schiedti]
MGSFTASSSVTESEFSEFVGARESASGTTFSNIPSPYSTYPWVIFQGNSVRISLAFQHPMILYSLLFGTPCDNIAAIPALDAPVSKVCFKSHSLDQSIGSDGVVFDEHSVVQGSHGLRTFSRDLVVFVLTNNVSKEINFIKTKFALRRCFT